MLQISAEQLSQRLDYPALIEALRGAFCADWIVPQRHHHDFHNPDASVPSTLLLMPAWETGKYLGLKTVIVSPENNQHNLPSIQGTYTLFDAKTGVALAQLDAPALTTRRTAATSALASGYLSRKDCRSLLMIGTGAMAPELIRAHASVRPLQEVFVWGRNYEKAVALVDSFNETGLQVKAVKTIAEVVQKVDIISCATFSKTPLVLGKWLRAGQHVDLVGSYRPDMREADDEVVRRCRIFADVRDAASKESGDLCVPLSEGLIGKKDILADLFDLCRAKHLGRTNAEDITCFKSVGHALEDLAAARLAFESV